MVISGSGLQIKNSANNIIILSLIFWRGDWDAIQIKRGAKNIWIDQCTIGRYYLPTQQETAGTCSCYSQTALVWTSIPQKVPWLCSFYRWKDGAIDITRGATLVTVSRTLFHHHNKASGEQRHSFMPWVHARRTGC